jgi:hypothetical protein
MPETNLKFITYRGKRVLEQNRGQAHYIFEDGIIYSINGGYFDGHERDQWNRWSIDPTSTILSDEEKAIVEMFRVSLGDVVTFVKGMSKPRVVVEEDVEEDEFDEAEEHDLYDSPYDRLSDAEQWEVEQREVFNDRLEMFRNEY